MLTVNIRTLPILFIATFVLQGCGRAEVDEDMPEGTGYTNADEQRRFKEALTDAKIPFEARRSANGEEVLRYQTRFRTEVAEVQAKLFGVPPPAGRSVSRDLMLRLEIELQKRSVPYRKASYHGTEYLAWDPQQDEVVDAVLRTFSANPAFVSGFQQDRREADTQTVDLTNGSSRSRENRASAER